MNAPQLPFPHGQLGRAGEAIAADPEGRNLVSAWETMQGFCGPLLNRRCTPPDPPGITAFGYSTDGGRTWTDAGAPPVVDHGFAAGHPWLDRGGVDDRTFYLVSRARSATSGYLVGINVYRGRFENGAFAWRDGRLLSPEKLGDFWRSSTVAAAKDGSGAVYVAYSNLRGMCGAPSRGAGQIEVIRSADGGDRWEKPVIVGPDDTFDTGDPKDPRCGTTGTTQISPSLAVGPAGEVYVLWEFGPWVPNYRPGPVAGQFETTHTLSFRVSRSLDGGRTFSAPVDAAWAYSLREAPPVGYSKDNLGDYTRIAVAEDGPHRGRVYVTYTTALSEVAAAPSEQILTSSQVYLVYSDDQGATWSAPVALGPRPPAVGLKRFWPTVAVEPGGRVDVLYLESQEGPIAGDPRLAGCAMVLPSGLFRAGEASSLVDLYRVQSTDGGATFGWPVRVTSQTTNWCQTLFDLGGFLEANFGNYLGIFPGEDRTYAVWTDGRNGVPDAYFAEIKNESRETAARLKPGRRH
jgi:hypothetical protein